MARISNGQSVPPLRRSTLWLLACILLCVLAVGARMRWKAVQTNFQTGSEKRPANHLIGETSPYLLQHAHNPVDWYPWGAEALQKAQKENKPIFLSVGYAACHWCHVMEREDFENAEIARI